MRIRHGVYLILLVSVILVAGCSAARPLHRSAASIRHSLLKRTPPGTSEQQVAAFIAREGWTIDHSEMNLELIHEEGGGPPVPEGVHDIWSAYLGSYIIFFGTRTTWGNWAFDANGRLIDVWIDRESDVL
jgi:hypothetical protein